MYINRDCDSGPSDMLGFGIGALFIIVVVLDSIKGKRILREVLAFRQFVKKCTREIVYWHY